ncbi:UNVERIFIED_CONTAM: Transmembrane 9 superfamily member 7 [Sesamum angustifolium]|uniref:Transmembrane 9 superfamily member n=1 Tax=Sesamum angustifolium TaxID=2727405 RepID=A0AAW2N7V9_9LAMI
MGEIGRMMMMISTFWVVVVVELLNKTSPANGFYLPGVAPRDFQTGEALEVKVNKLSSTKTQLPYDYYFLSYCKPPKIRNRAENLGEVLRGDRIENSVYSFSMRKPESCKIACRVKLTAASAKNFRKKINDDYRVNMILDNLPVAVVWQRKDGGERRIYERGFQVGFKGKYSGSKDQRYFINNHLNFKVKYHPDPDADTARVVGFEVTPLSINHHYKKWKENNTELSTCKHGIQTVLQPDSLVSIINSLMIVLFLSGMVAMIMARTLYRDIAKYNQLEQDEVQDETGWKLVHADVFRPPTNSSLLCVYIGTGVQVFGMTFVTMIFAMLGFLSPSNRGGLMTVMVFLWVFMGLFAGYSSGYSTK